MANIKQIIYFEGTAHEIYEALIDEKKHAAFTGAGAEIERKVGGKFIVWDGYASGENLELVQDKLIVQNWRASDWPEGVSSKVTFKLSDEKGKAKLEFSQTGVPEEFVSDVESGWKDFYWQPLQNKLNSSDF